MFGAAPTQQNSDVSNVQQRGAFAFSQQQQPQQQQPQQQQALTFGSAITQTPAGGSSFVQQAPSGFGDQQQQPQQQQQQSLFGSTQQSAFSDGSPQQQQSFFGQKQSDTMLLYSSNPRLWVLEGTPGSRLRWEKTEDGSIPKDAVEGGWCSTSNEPYYIARCTIGNTKNTTYGYVQAGKSSGRPTCHFVPHSVHSPNSYNSGGLFGGTPTPYYNSARQSISMYLAPVSPSSFEVLVNPDQGVELSWVPVSSNPLLFTYPDKKPVVPSNPVTFEDKGYKRVYIGRSIASKGSDSIPGCCSSENGLTIFEGIKQNGGRVYKKVQPIAFEVLCIVGDMGGDRVEQCFLYDVHYSKADTSIDMEYITLASTVLRNNCSEKQKMAWNPSPSMNYEDELTWDIGSGPMKHKCEVKAAVPYSPVNEDDDTSIQYTEVGELPPGLMIRPSFGMGGGGAFGAPSQPGHELIQPSDEDKVGSLLDKTTGYLSLGRVAKRKHMFISQSGGFTNDKPFVVPLRTSIKVGFRGCRKKVKVKFTGKLKTVYGNDCVKDEVVSGVFTGSQITNVTRTVSDQLPPR